MWRRPRTVAAATVGVLLLGWGTASALSGPEPVPSNYGGRFILTYARQNTAVFNVRGCELAPTGTGAAVVQPCRFEVPANAALSLKQKIAETLSSGVPPSSDAFTLTHYAPPTETQPEEMSDYAVTGQFRISQVTLPVLNPLATSVPGQNLVTAATTYTSAPLVGVELTPTSAEDVEQVPAAPPPSLPAPQPFEVDPYISCQQQDRTIRTVTVNPPPIRISGFTTTPPRSLSVSIDTSGQPAVKTGPVRIAQSDTAEVQNARQWLASSPQPGQPPSGPSQMRMFTLSLATYDCSTNTYSNQLTMTLPLVATSMDPVARTDGFFTLGLAPALAPGVAPRASWH